MISNKHLLTMSAISLLLSLSTLPQIGFGSVTQPAMTNRPQFQANWIYGGHLMTEGERREYREKMNQLRSQTEKEYFRMGHKRQMLERAQSLDSSMWRRYQKQ